MILNLQSNAIKFTNRGRVIIRAVVIRQNDESILEISVIDTGSGIKEEDQSKLFKLFGYI